MDETKNLHYQNKHGQQLKDYMKTSPNLAKIYYAGAQWSMIKYTIRAGKKEGESSEKDLGKRDDYVKEFMENPENDWIFEEDLIEQLNMLKEDFENWKG